MNHYADQTQIEHATGSEAPRLGSLPGEGLALQGRLPELLAPAGDWDCARAAVENGADAIYFGLEKFNARMRAQNFTEADLPALMEFLHGRGVKGYVTFNILVFEDEIAQAEQYARAIIAAGVDAAIVQDVGICRLLRELSPDFPIHVSTQMTVTSSAGIDFARELGCNLVVLARECSLKEIERMVAGRSPGAEAKAAAGAVVPPAQLPLEVFIHGALCVAYSGQCLTSEALGGRSANRGECAQACRLPYDLISDGKMVTLGDRKYLLSPQDLAGLEVVPDLARLGIASLKIEGRLKSPEYVANITRIYRQALDRLLPSPSAESAPGTSTIKSTEPRTGTPHSEPQAQADERYEMEMAFSRGLSTGWFGGTNNQALVHARFGKKRGVYLGKVAEVEADAVLVDLEGPLKPGDGVVFDAGRPEEPEQGGRVYGVKAMLASKPGRNSRTQNSGQGLHSTGAAPAVRLSFGHGDLDFSRIHTGDRLWKTSDPELERRLRRSFAGSVPKHQRPLSLEAHGAADQPLTLVARDEAGHVVQVQSAMPLARADKQPLTVARLREQLGRLGGTPFRLGDLDFSIQGEVLLPLSELNRLRREMVRDLVVLRAKPLRWTLQPRGIPSKPQDRQQERTPLPSPLPFRRGEGKDREPADVVYLAAPSVHTAESGARPQGHAAPTSDRPRLLVLVRNLAQLEAAMQSGLDTLYCDFEDPKKYREAVRMVRAARHGCPGTTEPEIWVAPPRIFKMGEEWTLQQVRSSEADGYLVRNYDHLRFFAQDRRIGDYSLNIANRRSAQYFKQKFGLERVTTSYDLNFIQLEALLQAAPPEWFEVTLHQHMPMFHMEHCVFCAFLSDGTDYTNCGRPCDKHDVKLRDRVGAEHPIKADAGCRNTVFNALAQTGAEYTERLLALGVRHFRLEFLNETAQQVGQTVEKYRQLLDGRLTGTQLWRELKLFNQLGVTRGQMAGQRA